MANKLIKNPTYLQHIRHFFDEVDLDHMFQKGIDLSTYDALVDRDTQVLLQTEPPNANMPPKASRKWNRKKWETYKNWITTGHPLGNPKPTKPKIVKVERLRKDADNLTSKEIKLLTKAFRGIMDLDDDKPDGYFTVAGIHWYPEPSRCEHHVDKYNPWHRAYMKRFEDALRTVDGCENVTIPYWDITKPPPAFLFKKPFSKYILPQDVDTDLDHKKGSETKRFTRAEITKRVKANGVPDTITEAMTKPIWNEFRAHTSNGIEAAHDAGHGAIGDSVATPDIASFDPIFWFFHANWDRLWWEWQQSMQATTYWAFRSTIRGSTTFMEPGLDDLKPFSLTVGQTINSHDLGIGYEPQPSPLVTAFNHALDGSQIAAKSIRIRKEPIASVRLKGIDRMNIPGSFRAVLRADGKTVGERFFFQSKNPKQCENCKENAVINLDFQVPVSALTDKDLDVELHLLVSPEGLSSRFPLHAAGNPTLNARLMIESI